MTAELSFDLLSVTALLPRHKMHATVGYNYSGYLPELQMEAITCIACHDALRQASG
jgi:hypothetical protein